MATFKVGTSPRAGRWTPPERPAWVERINEEGSRLDLRRVVPLDEDSLIASAIADTGFSDFGEDSWREPFRVLVNALDEEADLNLVGRLMTRSDLLMFLQARLRVEAAYRAHPEIQDERIVKPLIIVGQGRSGTSMLQYLLDEDPDSGSLHNWEVMFPCPPPDPSTATNDPRVQVADSRITQPVRVVPELATMHEYRGHLPTESIHLHSLAFRSPAWFDVKLGQAPSYSRYMSTQDPAEPYRYEKRLLKLLQWRNPRRTWVMKSPYSLSHLPSILEVYPDASFVWPHRDPVRAVASVVSLVGTLHWVRSDHPFNSDTLAVLTDPTRVARLLSQPIEWIERGRIPRERLCNVRYADLVRDPISVVEQIYGYFGIEATDDGRQAMAGYLERSKRSDRPAHAYDLGSSEEITLERGLFQEYQQYFDVPNEV